MTDIDFIKQKNKSTSAKSGKMKYGVEYTDPNKSHRSLKEWFRGFGTKRKHVAAAVPPAAPRPLAPVTATTTAQAHAKPEIAAVPISGLSSRPVTTMPTAVQPTSASTTASALAPALAPLTRAAVAAAATRPQFTVQPPIAQPVPSIPVPASTPAPKAFSLPTSTLAMPVDKTMLIKVQPGAKQASAATVTALRVIPTPPLPPTHNATHISQSVAGGPMHTTPAAQPQPHAFLLPKAPIVPAAAHTSVTPPAVPVIKEITTSSLPVQPLPVKAVTARVLPKAPAPPLHGLPVTVTQENKVKTAVATAKTHTQVEVNINDIQAHNVSEYSGATTNPNRPAETALHINLMPQLNAVLTPLISKVRYVVNTLLFSGLVIGIGYLGILGYQTYYFVRTNINLTQISALDNQILTYRSLQDKVNATAGQLTTINTLLSEHYYWTNVFVLLEEYTLPNVYYTLVSADTKGTVTLQAVTSDYASVSHQIAVFKQANRFIQQVDVATASGASTVKTAGEAAVSDSTVSDSGVISFNITLQIKPEVLQYHYDGYFKN